MERKRGKLYCSDRIQYIYNNEITSYRGRPVAKVEVIKRENGKVTFLTDYPVEKITIKEESFNKHFHRW